MIMKQIYLVCLYQIMYIFSTYIHILYINIVLFRDVIYKYTTLRCSFSHEYTEMQL